MSLEFPGANVSNEQDVLAGWDIGSKGEEIQPFSNLFVDIAVAVNIAGSD